ncbi:MAG: carboxypeptidase M32 [Syntrophobacteraceae bacterium]
MDLRYAYNRLEEHYRESALYESMMHLLGWDQRTCLPQMGNSHRSNQVAALTGLLYRRNIDPLIGEMLERLEGSDLVADPLSTEAVNIREWRRSYDRVRRVPEKLAVEIARTSSESELAWQTARPGNDWEGFLPHLQRIIALKREEAALLSREGEIYNALIQDFEPGEDAGSIEKIFGRLSAALIELLDRIRGSSRKPEPAVLFGNAPVSVQNELITHIIQAVGYNLAAGRLDRSAHPFSSTIGPGDVRITTRYNESSFAYALFSSLHETGHALYEQGLPSENWGSPRGTAVSMAIHESQSLMWENMVGRSAGFWKHFLPTARKHFPFLNSVPFDNFILAVNEVSAGLIRTEADEVTYNLHIILRFELERALISGQMDAGDLPEAWNEKMQRYLGITPPDHTSGVMQDVHWSGGSIGYFPSYALGNIYAAQFYDKAARDLGDPEHTFASGDFSSFLGWFREKIHSEGSRYLPRSLVKAATGEELDPKYLIGYLNRKYGELYELG